MEEFKNIGVTTTTGSSNRGDHREGPTPLSQALQTYGLLTLSTFAVGFVMVRLLHKLRCCQSSHRAITNNDEAGVKDGGEPAKRRMSFTSASMAMGAFPPECQMVDPIINVALLYTSEEGCPTAQDLIPVVMKILEYQRCKGIPHGTMGKNDWTVREPADHGSDGVDPMDMIREIDVPSSGDDDDENDEDGGGGEEALFQLIDERCQDGLRDAKDRKGGKELPWWEFLILKNPGKGPSAILFRVEHVIGDGLSIVTLFENFLSYSDGSPMDTLIPQSMNRKFVRSESRASLMWKIMKSTAKVLALPASKYDDTIVFNRGTGKDMVYSGTRKSVIFNTVPLDFIKALKDAASVTINDIMFTAFSDAIHNYSMKRECETLPKMGTDVQFRALMPIAFPRPGEETKDTTRALRNKWVFVSSDMGVGHTSIMERLQANHERLSQLKKSPIAACQWKVQESIPPLLPITLARQTVFDTFSRHSCVFSNVPGAQKQCSFAGKKVDGAHFFFNNLIPQVNVLSYNERIFMNMEVDPDVVEHSGMIPIYFSKALVELARNFNVVVPDCVRKHSEKPI